MYSMCISFEDEINWGPPAASLRRGLPPPRPPFGLSSRAHFTGKDRRIAALPLSLKSDISSIREPFPGLLHRQPTNMGASGQKGVFLSQVT